jgi:predicted nucleotidyltransferase component of viral defense system
MQNLKLHEKFEIEVLGVLNSRKLLEPLSFGGGTMLRLCHGLNRYSVDLDFYFLKDIDIDEFDKKVLNCLSDMYNLTDFAKKHFTLLYECKSKDYPQRIKVEVRKAVQEFKYEESIAFSVHSNEQVLLKTLTLEQMMQNKINAFLGRYAIRDCFDIEFLMKKGIELNISRETALMIKSRITGFKKKDFDVSLGSLLEEEDRRYYSDNGFKILNSKLQDLGV